MRSTDGPDDDPQGPEHNVAQPRADSSAVARFNVADLELASLRENVVREREKLHTTRQAAEETEPEVIEARHWGKRAGKIHPTEAKPADSEVQSQVSKDGRIQQKDDASQGKKRRRSEEESSATSKKEREDGISHPAQRLYSTIQKRGSRSPRAMQERSVKNKTRNRSRPQCERHCEAGDDGERERGREQKTPPRSTKMAAFSRKTVHSNK